MDITGVRAYIWSVEISGEGLIGPDALKAEYRWNANTLVSRDPSCHEACLAADILLRYVCNIDGANVPA